MVGVTLGDSVIVGVGVGVVEVEVIVGVGVGVVEVEVIVGVTVLVGVGLGEGFMIPTCQ
jgi:hypothetical protein